MVYNNAKGQPARRIRKLISDLEAPEPVVSDFRQKCQLADQYLKQAMESQNYKELAIKAFNLYTEVINENPACTEAYKGLACITYAFKNIPQTIRLLKKVLQLSPHELEVQIFLINIEENLPSEPSRPSPASTLMQTTATGSLIETSDDPVLASKNIQRSAYQSNPFNKGSSPTNFKAVL